MYPCWTCKYWNWPTMWGGKGYSMKKHRVGQLEIRVHAFQAVSLSYFCNFKLKHAYVAPNILRTCFSCVIFNLFFYLKVRNKVLESRGGILSLVGRGIEIVWKLGLYWSTLSYDFLVGRDEEVVPFRARQLRNLLCDLGPSFIKAGQVCNCASASAFFWINLVVLLPQCVFYLTWKF